MFVFFLILLHCNTKTITKPIMISEEGYIIDGRHRLAKSFLDNKKTISAYVFTNEFLEKFKFAENEEEERDMRLFKLFEKYHYGFCG